MVCIDKVSSFICLAVECILKLSLFLLSKRAVVSMFALQSLDITHDNVNALLLASTLVGSVDHVNMC